MAIPADTVWEVETTGSDLNGGGWSAASKGVTGVDMTLGAATSFTSTLSATGTTTLTDSANGFVNTMRGNVVNIVGQGFYCITAFLTSGTVTVDRALGTFSTTSGKVGGPVASIGTVGSAAPPAGNTVFIKSGNYTISSATTNISGGCFSSALNLLIIGYANSRAMWNTDAKPYIVLGAGVSAATIFAGGGNNVLIIYNLSLDGATQTTSRGCVAGTGASIACLFANFTNGATATDAYGCEFTGCTTVGVATGTSAYCVAHGNSAISFTNIAMMCVAYANTSTGFSGPTCVNCTAYGNTLDGFLTNAALRTVWINCVSESNGRYGFNSTSSTVNHVMINCSAFGNSTAATNGSFQATGLLAPSASAFVSAASQDFRLNILPGAGALLRAAGYPSTAWPSLAASMLAYLDIGAVQSRNLDCRWGMSGGMSG